MSYNADLVRSVFETTFTADAVDGVLGHYHRDLVYHPRPVDPEPGVIRGRDAFGELIRGYVEALSTITFDILEVIEAGNRVVISTVLRGHGSVSGVTVSDPYVFVYTVRDGLVAEGWEFATLAEALQPVGG